MRGICIRIFAGALAVGSAASAAGAGTPVRFEELAKLDRIGGFDLSPDGKWIAYSVGTPVIAENRTKSAIWLAPSAGGAPRRLTSGDKRDSDPAFSPDGRRVAFLSNHDGSSQIWTIDLSGGEPSKATSFLTEVNGFKWSPDGKWFVIASDVFPDCTDVACLDEHAKARAKSGTKARVAERLLFRHWDAWKEGLRTHVWKVPATGGGPAVDLTPGDHDAPPFDVGGALDFDVSPDGKEFVYASNRDPVEALSTNSDLWLVPFAGGAPPKNLTAANKAFDGTPKFSPDGKWIAYRAQKRPGFESDRFALVLYDRASGATRELAQGFDDWVEDYEWAPDSRSIFFLSHVKGRGVIERAAVAGGPPTQVWRGGGPLQTAPSPDGSLLFFSASSLKRPTEIFALPLSGSAPAGATPRTVIRASEALLGSIEMGAVSERFTKSADGRDLHAWLVTPPGFDPGKRYPAVVLIHGGPQSAWNDSWSTRWNPEVFAAYGYVVYAPNPRGSTGFGQEFVDQVSRDWGGRAYDDLMRQTDDLESLPYVDRAHIGAAGASYGGYMVAWILGHTDRFKALVCHDGVVDPRSMALETEELWFPVWEFGGWPWESDLHEKWNPLRFVEKFKTPTLVVTSEKDYRVPFGQGLQLFTALQVRGVPSKILTFPDEGHWVLKPGNSRVWHATVMDWLATYLHGARPDKESLEAVSSITK
ncbi:MAG TPA: S9 family peptidase [Thermoanaerobaculia bacterium]|jgi:dipeptidyl aminopeptidase/acylaminoacyl peptidase|nr:S9 family peptidase [Thermoanaerobaculia bacterium]